MDHQQPPSTVPQLIAETVVPASTTTPVPEGDTKRPPVSGPQPPSNIAIEITTDANDALVASLTGIVNQVYFDTEKDLFLEGTQRTDEQEVRSIMQAGELAVMYILPPPDPQAATAQPPPRKAVGCIRIRRFADDVGELGMLALAPSHQGGGMGSALMRFGEGHVRGTLGLPVARLELLVPSGFHHAFKARLQAWYEKMGYRVVRLGVFQDEYPKAAALLRGPTEYRVFEKTLGA
ncbi:hypothetical protein PG999_014698 [Apiospora kogelbergensis]|uniref:N-acetyltransferase domain-containing protein n=1 Tax=Apiospora kogelbergensis TaxID=1337665 RepID=A0AAW0QCN0_9PEZI